MVRWIISQDSAHIVGVGVGSRIRAGGNYHSGWYLALGDGLPEGNDVRLARFRTLEEAVDALGEVAHWLAHDQKSNLLNMAVEYPPGE